MAWEIEGGAPFVAASLGTSLLNLGRVAESAKRMAGAAEHSQSYEVVHLACWHLCALAETVGMEDRQRLLGCAKELGNKLYTLAPLADHRKMRTLSAPTDLDIAEVADDHASMELWAEEARSPFHRKVLRNLRQNRQGSRIRFTTSPMPFRNTRSACPQALRQRLVRWE